MTYNGGTENTPDDVDVLEGATITKVTFADWDDGFEVVPKGVVRLRVKYKNGLKVNGSAFGEFEIWRDPEANGPGFIALVGPAA
jgi:hypothetical protein